MGKLQLHHYILFLANKKYYSWHLLNFFSQKQPLFPNWLDILLEVGKNLNEMIELLAKNEEVDNQKVKELNDAIHELKKDIAENAIAIGGFLFHASDTLEN